MEEERDSAEQIWLQDSSSEIESQEETCILAGNFDNDSESPQLYEGDSIARHPSGRENYPSLYDTIPTTFGAILLGIGIITLIQIKVKHIFDTQKRDHKALTQFVTTMFALIVGIWIADKLIAGPDTELLEESESRDVLNFIKDTTLMVFAYYFGTKAQVPKDEKD